MIMHPYPTALRLLVLATATCATAAAAQDRDTPHFGLGVGALNRETAYGFSETEALPLIRFDSRYFRLNGGTADLKLPWFSTDTLGFALRSEFYSGEGYSASDDPSLAGMAEREQGLWLGGALDWRLGDVTLGFAALSDVGGESDGQKITAEVSQVLALGTRFTVTSRLGAVWMDDAAVNYFYGVGTDEARPGRDAYAGRSTVNIEAGVSLGYHLTQDQMLILDISATRLGDGIADSPIVEDDTLSAVSLGYMYRF